MNEQIIDQIKEILDVFINHLEIDEEDDDNTDDIRKDTIIH